MSNPADLPPLPKNHLDHPENWATGGEPATAKQKGFVDVLAHDHADLLPADGLDIDHMGKSEASAVIDHLKNGKPLDDKDTKDEPKKVNGEAEEAKQSNVTKEADSEAPASPPSKKRKNTSSKEQSSKAEVPTEDTDITMDADDEASASVKRKSSSKQNEELDGVEGTIADDEKEEEVSIKPRSDKEVKGNGHAKESVKENGEKAAVIDDEKSEEEGDQGPATKKVKIDTAQDEEDSKTYNGHSTTDTASSAAKGETTPGDGKHLDHPENWATGDEPATEKQKGFVAVLEKKAGREVSDKENMGKSEASEIIEELKGQ